MVWLALLGCPKTPVAEAPIWAPNPRLPAPKAGSYGRSPEPPPDPAVARLLGSRSWDASLSGAAAGLALSLVRSVDGTASLQRWTVREAVWNAGYPYPVTDVRAWNANPDGSPPPATVAWLQSVPSDADLGLVRARGQNGDVWVGLFANATEDIGRVPRQVALDGILTLPALNGATYHVADADGHLTTGSLDSVASLPAGSRGEWLVDIRKDGANIARFPVYVGLVPPDGPPFEEAPSLSDVDNAIAGTQRVLSELRDVYGAPPPARDFLLDAGARSMLAANDTTLDGVVASLALSKAHTASWTCRNQSIPACLDGMMWIPENRAALLDPNVGLGLAAQMEPEGVRLVGILGRTE